MEILVDIKDFADERSVSIAPSQHSTVGVLIPYDAFVKAAAIFVLEHPQEVFDMVATYSGEIHYTGSPESINEY